MFDRKYLSIFYENVDGISDHKCIDFLTSSSSCDYDVIALTETWLDNSIKNSEFLSDLYTVYRKDRSNTSIKNKLGGGVLLAIRAEIECVEYTNDDMRDLEAVCIRIPLSSSSIFIYCLYIQCSGSIELYQAHLKAIKTLRTDADTNDDITILGDWNFGSAASWEANDMGYDFIPKIHTSKAKTNIARESTISLMDDGFFQMTDIGNNVGNVLDLVYTNSPELVVVNKADFLLLPPTKSDKSHVPLMCTIECSPISIPSGDSSKIFCFKKANYDQIREHLLNVGIHNMFDNSQDDVNTMVGRFYDILYSTFEEFVPQATIRSTNKPLWYDKELSHLKNIRNKEYKKLCFEREKCADPDDDAFMSAKCEYEKRRQELHSKFIREKASCAKTNPKSFWQFVNSKRKSNTLPAKMFLNDKSATTDKEKADLFACHFQSVYVQHDDDPNLNNFIQQRQDGNCFNLNFDIDIIHSVLVKMELNKGSGHDGVSSLFLRECADFLAKPLSDIFTRSMDDGCYPDAFKIGQITPIFKSGNRSHVNNNRGVCTSPNLAKVFERSTYNQLKLIIHPRISKAQHGFLPNRGIETNLMELTSLAHDAFAMKAQLDVISTDLRAAFDLVDISILIRKLAGNYPVTNKLLAWLVSYFHKRKQYVKIGSAKSEFFNVTSGVGQGTILGPLWFTVFFDDSNTDIPGVFHLNFADDKLIAAIVKTDADACKLQSATNQFIDWCCSNNMQMNTGKCQSITFTHKRNPIMYNYVMETQIVKRVSEIRCLGVRMDAKMNFNPHFEYIINKARGSLAFVKRQSHFLDKDVTMILYAALTRSILDFATPIWSPQHLVHKKEIESIQKQMLIFFNGDHLNRSENNYVLRPYTDRCSEANIQTLCRRRINASVMFIHGLISGKLVDPNLRNRITLNSGVRTIRNPEFIRLKFASTNSPFYNACHIYNHAAMFIDPTLPMHDFKRQLERLPDCAFGPWSRLKS